MRILFFTSSIEDYLGDPLLHGLRLLYGKNCVDYPKCDILYKDCPEELLRQVRGNGFTLYTGLLEDGCIDRFNIEDKIRNSYFDLIIISDIQRQFGWFVHFRPYLNRHNTIVLDGLDTTQPYPARGYWWRRPYYWFLPKAHRDFLYFKREWTPDTHFYLWMRLLPAWLRAKLPQPENLRPIGFSIPEQKIIQHLPEKKKDFPIHIVDPEVAERIPGSHTSYAFSTEKEYYTDLRQSRFGISTKRAGWDCLRHYEIAANGAVICFRDLDKKPATCAPHGLEDGVNCISYSSFDGLMARINSLTSDQYTTLQMNSLHWVRANTSIRRAEEVLRAANRLPSEVLAAEDSYEHVYDNIGLKSI